uniref:Tetratricopeptide repeat domain 41 n=1 Tax=Jaculus jaculus TaxID=51337 RepID=A0A8C5K313_JACJA
MSQKAKENVVRNNTLFLLKPQKPIQPYICSTLDDFEEERDFLATTIFPRLNDSCIARGTCFKAVDLRWAAVKTQNSFPASLSRQYSCLNSQHLKLCLDNVDSCFPFFICLLGQTYGDFLPDHSPSLFSTATDLASLSKEEQNLYVAAKNGYPWVLETPNCSVTEFEIMQAAFRKESQFQYFYFRTGSSLLKTLSEVEKVKPPSGSLVNEEGKLKIGKLKAKIISKGLPVRFYKDLHELGELVFKDWLAVIEKLYPATVMMDNIDYKHSFERLYHEDFTEKCKQVFVISKESSRTFEILERFVLKDVELNSNKATGGSSLDNILRINSLPTNKSILLLSGERGCGKSTLIASWVDYFKNKYPSTLVIPYFVGSTCESSDITSVLHYFVVELQHNAHGEEAGRHVLSESAGVIFVLFVHAGFGRPSNLTVSEVFKCLWIYQAKDFSWLPHPLPPHCKFVLTTISSSVSCKLLCARPDVKTVELACTGDEDTKLSIFRRHLSAHALDLFSQSQPILKKKPSLNALKLTILASELKECRIYRNEFQCMRKYLEAASIQELWELTLKRWVEDYSWNLKQKGANFDFPHIRLDGWVADVLCLLCTSHCGLAEDELLRLLDMLGYRNHCKVTTMHWAAFRNATKQWVQEKPNGLLYFRHQSLRNAVEHRLLGVITPVRENKPSTSQSAVNYKKIHFHRLMMRYFQRQTTFWRVYQELPWHLKMSECWDGLCSFVTSPSIIDFISKIRNPSLWTRLHLAHYWSTLLGAGYDVAQAFLLSVGKIEGEQHQTVRKRPTLSVLECSLSQVTATDKCRMLLFIGRFLKLMGKTSDAERLFLSVEGKLLQNQSLTEMLLKTQNAVGELYLEIGMTQKGFSYFQEAWSNLLSFSLSDLKNSQDLMKQKVNVLNNLAKSASQEFLKENHILEYATEVSKLVSNNPLDQATMKYTEGILMLVAGNTFLAKLKFQECLNIRRSLFGDKNMPVGEIMESLADLLFFLLRDNEKSQRKQVNEYYRQVIRIKENADALTTSKLVRKQLNISLSNTMYKLAAHLLVSDSCHHSMLEAVGYLYRALDLRVTHLGSSHSSIHGILQLLREIKRFNGSKCWPQGTSQQYPESFKNCFVLWEHLPKLNYHSAHGSNSVSSAVCMHAGKFQRAESMALAPLPPPPIPDKSKWAFGKGKRGLTSAMNTSAEEKTQQKTRNVQIWNGPRKQGPVKPKDLDCSFRILSLDKVNCLVRLSRQKILSTKSESGEGHITTIYHHSLPAPGNMNKPWESISELISEKWLFHSPQCGLTPHKSILQRRPQTETKFLKIPTNMNKE